MKSSKNLCLGLFVTLLAGLFANASDLAQNIRVVWCGNAQTEAVVVWDSSVADKNARLAYDSVSHADGKTRYAFETPVKETGPYIPGMKQEGTETVPSAPAHPDFFYHHAELKNLTPDTVYYLAVKTSEGLDQEYHFKTAPVDGKPLKLIYAGDSRTYLDITRQISMNIRKMIEADDSVTALLHGGDYAETTTIPLWKEWLAAYELTTTEDGKLLPIIPIVGNHDLIDNSPIFRQAYGNPGGGKSYFTLQVTPSVRILCLNSETDVNGEQKKFLTEALSAMDEDNVTWRIAAFHFPVYPAIKKPGAARTKWVPLFEKFHVTLVLESDGHCIKRTVPILNDKEDPDGIVYLGESGYGAPQRDPKMDRWYLQGENAFASRGDHIMLLEITPDQISYSTVLSTGDVVDSALFKARKAPVIPILIVE